MPAHARILVAATLALSAPALAETAPPPVEHLEYARQGALELGGSAGFTVAANLRDFTFSPIVGWFVRDNLELSAILNLSHVSTGDDSTTVIGALAEPSYHLPFNSNLFGFLGVGVGAAYVRGQGAGLAIAPRFGANILVGRSGILTPSLSWQYTTHDVNLMDGAADAMAAVSSALRMNVGYTVMW